MIDKCDLEKIEEARKIYNENKINELLNDVEKNSIRKDKLKKIENGKKPSEDRK